LEKQSPNEKENSNKLKRELLKKRNVGICRKKSFETPLLKIEL